MTTAHFLQTRRQAWDLLEKLVKKAGRKGLSALSEEELHELTRLYPAVAVDVARARMHQVDPQTQRRLNQIAIAAHGLLYVRRHTRLGPVLWRFLRYDYPRLFRGLWTYVALAVAIFAVSALSAYVITLLRPSAAFVLVPGGARSLGGKDRPESGDMIERFRQTPRPVMAAGIMSNNIGVAFAAFALGIAAGLGTCYVLIMNAMTLGGLAGHFANHGLAHELWIAVAAHGMLEFLAIFIAAGAGLRMGLSLAVPGRLTRKASLKAGAREAVLLVLGTVPMFAVAALIEGFLTPAEIGSSARIAAGAAAALVFLAYLLCVGRRPRAHDTEKAKAAERP